MITLVGKTTYILHGLLLFYGVTSIANRPEELLQSRNICQAKSEYLSLLVLQDSISVAAE